ncbi:MAG: serine/threonine-protein kinase [Planctomycetota bacterium]
MDARQTTTFERCALASGLVKQVQLDEARAALRAAGGDSPYPQAPPTDEQLAQALVDLGALNLWQSKQLLEGRTKFNLGPYWMVDSIGRGGMGQVFKAEHDVLRRVVAVKVLPRSKTTPASIANFLQEIRVLARLDHPNLVRALDAGEDGNVCYLVTEYVPGTDLRKLVRREGAMSSETAAGVISQAAAGLAHAHAQGLIHRDVKPGNVLVTPDGHAKLSDLGLAGPLDGDAQGDSRYGKIVGTADYLSPDHVQAPWNPTPARDIYSLGCTLYYAVTGKVPFPGGSIADKVRAHRELRPLDPRKLNPTLSVAFVELLADMMAKDPSERLQTAEAVIARLAPWLDTPAPVVVGDGRRRQDTPESSASSAFGNAALPSSTRASAGVEKSGSDETKSSFPEIPEALDREGEPSGESSEVTHPLASAGQETSPAMERVSDPPSQPLAVFHPLVVLVLFPVSLVGLVMLIWWMFHPVVP